MTRDELECWWWWKKNPPTRLDEWPAYRYELASRATDKKSTTKEPKQPHYLLGKPYPKLTPEQKALVRRIFGRKTSVNAIRFLFEWEEPAIMLALRLKREVMQPLPVSASSKERAITTVLEKIEQRHVARTGCTFPRLITIDLHASKGKIEETLMEYVEQEQRRLGVPEPTHKEATIWANKGNAHRYRTPPFQHIESLDQLRNFRDRTGYDDQSGQQSRAATKARLHRQEWYSKLKSVEREKRQAEKETARLQVIVGKLQRGEISDVEAMRKIWRISG